MAASEAEEGYHRRLDRSPEKDDFYKVPETDRHLISNLRSAMEGARDKVTRLRDEMEDRERDATREKALRQAAEARLEQLVDMYGDPAVNDELRDRLPRASKSDPKKELEEEIMNKQNQGNLQAGNGRNEQDWNDHDNKGAGGSGTKGKRLIRQGTYEKDEPDGRKPGANTTPDSHYPMMSPYAFPGYAMPMQYPPMYPYPGAAVPNMIPVSETMGRGQGGYMPAMSAQGVQQVPMDQFGRPQFLGGGGLAQMASLGHALQPGMQMQNYSTADGVSGVGLSGVGPSGAVTQDRNQSGNIGGQGLPGNAEAENKYGTNGSNGTSGTFGANGSLGATGFGNRSGPTGGTNAGADVSGASNGEANRQIAMLLTELDLALENNKKLQEKLRKTEEELESLRLTIRTQHEATDAEVAKKAAELVEEVYRAQKIRDNAMMGRLKLANEERDCALLKLRQMARGVEAIDLDGLDDQDVRNLLKQLDNAEAPGQVEGIGDGLAKILQKASSRRQEVTTEEMRAIIEERDTYLNRCKLLESEIQRLQREKRGQSIELQNNTSLQAKLKATQQERDAALDRVARMDEEKQMMQMFQSLKKTSSPERNLHDHYNKGLIEDQMKEVKRSQLQSSMDFTEKENNKMLAQLKSALVDKNNLQEALAQSQKAQYDSQNNCEKLERLVNVLRRKINGMGAPLDD